MVKIAVAAVLILGGLVIMGKARGPAALLGLVTLIVGIVGAGALYMGSGS